MASLAAAFPTNMDFSKDRQAMEWAKYQRTQQTQQQQLESQRLNSLQQSQSQRPMFQRGQDNDVLYNTSFGKQNFHGGFQKQVQMKIGGAVMEPIQARQPSLVNNFGQAIGQQSYDPNYFQKMNPGGKPSDIDFSSLTPDHFTKYQLFYTQGSQFCKNFLHYLAQAPEIDKEIQKIDVDELRRNGHRVEGLVGVPTIIDNNVAYLGKNALGWLSDKSAHTVMGMDISDDIGYSPIEQTTSNTAWGSETMGGSSFSFVFENNQIQDFDARSLLTPQNASGRSANSSLDQEIARLQKSRDQQIQISRQGGPNQGGGNRMMPSQQQTPAFSQFSNQTHQSTRGSSSSIGVPAYNPNGPNTMQPAGPGGGYGGGGGYPQQGGYGGGGYPQQQQHGGYGSGYPQQGGYGGGGGYPQQQQHAGYGSGYPQQQQQGGGDNRPLPDFLKSQDPRQPSPVHRR